MKPTILNLFIVALGLTSLFSCQKRKKDVVLHVHVQDAETKEPLAGHRWILFSTRTASGGEKVTDEWSGTVDENGDAYIDAELKLNRSNNLIVEPLEDQCYINTQAYYPSIHKTNDETYLFELAACGQLGLELKNVNCQGEEDELYFEMTHAHATGALSIGAYDFPRKGCYDYSTQLSPKAYGTYNVRWKVVRNGVTNEYDSTYYLEKGGNQTFVLEY